MKFIAIVSSLAVVIGSEAFVSVGNTRQSFTGECAPQKLMNTGSRFSDRSSSEPAFVVLVEVCAPRAIVMGSRTEIFRPKRLRESRAGSERRRTDRGFPNSRCVHSTGGGEGGGAGHDVYMAYKSSSSVQTFDSEECMNPGIPSSFATSLRLPISECGSNNRR
jgi:hypothetical protein